MDAKQRIARRVAQELRDGDIVNLGIGLPTMVANYLPEGIHITLQSENGFLGLGPVTTAHPDLYISIDIMVLPVFCRMGDYWDLLRGCFGSYFDLLGFLCHASALPT